MTEINGVEPIYGIPVAYVCGDGFTHIDRQCPKALVRPLGFARTPHELGTMACFHCVNDSPTSVGDDFYLAVTNQKLEKTARNAWIADMRDRHTTQRHEVDSVGRLARLLALLTRMLPDPPGWGTTGGPTKGTS